MTTLTHDDAIALRDALTVRMPEGFFPFHCLGVRVEGNELVVHFIARPGMDSTAVLQASLDVSRFQGWPVRLEGYPWGLTLPVPWSQLAKETYCTMPHLVLIEEPDGRVWGVVTHQLHRDASDFCHHHAEADEAREGVTALRALDADAPFMGFFKVANIEADSLDEAMRQFDLPSPHWGHVLVYRDLQWWEGSWGGMYPEGAPPAELHLGPVADYYPIRVARVLVEQREGGDVVRAGATMTGDLALLQRAVDLAWPDAPSESNFEDDPGSRLLCDWWNAQAPQGLLRADVLRVYVWDEDLRVFQPCDPDEPPRLADSWQGCHYAWFEDADVLVHFYQGRQGYLVDPQNPEHCTLVMDLAGQLLHSVGAHISQLDEAWYGVAGLARLRHHLRHEYAYTDDEDESWDSEEGVPSELVLPPPAPTALVRGALRWRTAPAVPVDQDAVQAWLLDEGVTVLRVGRIALSVETDQVTMELLLDASLAPAAHGGPVTVPIRETADGLGQWFDLFETASAAVYF